MNRFVISKSPLSVQTAECLRQAIKEHSFGPVVPPERILAEQLEVSRPILREALGQLEREGLIQFEGKRRRIATETDTFKKQGHAIESARLLSYQPLGMFNNEQIQLSEFLSTVFANHGIDFHVEVSRSSFEKSPERSLKNLLERTPGTLWILYRSTHAMQEWFQRHKIPCFVLGSLYQDVDLLNVDVNYQSVSRHAAGLFRSRGHKQVAIFHRDRVLPGDEQSFRGFLEGWRNVGDQEPHPHKMVSHSANPESLVRSAAAILRLRNPPKAWFIFGSRDVFTLVGWMASEGIRMGKDIHLLSRDSDPYFESIEGGIAHYHRNFEQMKKRTKRLINQIFEQKLWAKTKTRTRMVDLDFVDGRSLGRCKDMDPSISKLL